MLEPTRKLVDRSGVDLIAADMRPQYYRSALTSEPMVELDLVDSRGRIHRGVIAVADLEVMA